MAHDTSLRPSSVVRPDFNPAPSPPAGNRFAIGEAAESSQHAATEELAAAQTVSAAKTVSAGKTAGRGLSGPLRQTIALLLQGHSYAAQTDHDIWDFAVEIEELRRTGVTRNDLRWMVANGWFEHGREITQASDEDRPVEFSRPLSFDSASCFVLTPLGVRLAHQTLNEAERSIDACSLVGGPSSSATLSQIPMQPSWDSQCHRLFVGGELVKEFKLPSPNQGTILMAFEEEGWPARIDDPLPPSPDTDSKSRLRYTIKSLNKNQKKRLIRFMGDGSGEGIIWELVLTR